MPRPSSYKAHLGMLTTQGMATYPPWSINTLNGISNGIAIWWVGWKPYPFLHEKAKNKS